MASLDPNNIPWHDALLNILENYNLVTMNPDNLGTPDDYLKRGNRKTSQYLRSVFRYLCDSFNSTYFHQFQDFSVPIVVPVANPLGRFNGAYRRTLNSENVSRFI